MAGLESAPVVARVVRNGFVEAVHHGLGVITGPDGSVEFVVGDAATPVFPRSSAKPFQALAALRAGAPLTGAHLALACSSHSGEAFHLDAVRAALAASGLGVDDLANTPDLPAGEDARAAWLASGAGKQSLAQNCSGKHAGMLAACVASGWPTLGYLDPEHPLQRLIAGTITEVVGEPLVAWGVDGCGSPVPAFALRGLARGFGRFAAASEGFERQIADAMRTHPEFVGGTGREATLLMRDAPGVIAKDGADGVFAVGLPDGRGVALKITDGADRARGPLLAELLRRAGGVPQQALDRLAHVSVLGHGGEVGVVTYAGLSEGA